MQDNENLSENEPTATDETAGGGPESTAPEQHETADLHRSNETNPKTKPLRLNQLSL